MSHVPHLPQDGGNADGAGLTAREIADVLGHSQPSMTLNTYMGRGQVSRASADALNSVTSR